MTAMPMELRQVTADAPSDGEESKAPFGLSKRMNRVEE